MTDKKIKQIVIDVEIGEYCVEEVGFKIPEELDAENVEYIFGSVLANMNDDVRYCVSCEYTDTEIKGKFHQWISEYAANEYGERSNLYAVVEMDDGTIALYEHDLIRFID
ncbi:hypothetical protein [Enterococcus gallinarum]|uniref:hypothetical protein n=2 Tax=Enterococcus TaxID=1350 RepID=UPI002952F8A0|nr:hypothetical protein [Enterococcus gallinarum]MDV7787733.1 hypothetical protein [Enterococcus gallinarum]